MATRDTILRLINASQHSICPCHGHTALRGHPNSQMTAFNQLRKFANPAVTVEKEYAFEASSLSLDLLEFSCINQSGRCVQSALW